jgi:hypothetical protein
MADFEKLYGTVYAEFDSHGEKSQSKWFKLPAIELNPAGETELRKIVKNLPAFSLQPQIEGPKGVYVTKLYFRFVNGQLSLVHEMRDPLPTNSSVVGARIMSFPISKNEMFKILQACHLTGSKITTYVLVADYEAVDSARRAPTNSFQSKLNFWKERLDTPAEDSDSDSDSDSESDEELPPLATPADETADAMRQLDELLEELNAMPAKREVPVEPSRGMPPEAAAAIDKLLDELRELRLTWNTNFSSPNF